MHGRREAWAASGAMYLTGRTDGPGLGAPAALIDLVRGAAAVLSRRSDDRANVDGLALLGERAALAGLTRQAPISCGGGARLVRASDGWLAVSLARPEDVASVPAWLEMDVDGTDPWPQIEATVGRLRADDLDNRAALLGLPIAAVGSVGPGEAGFGLPIPAVPHGPSSRPLAISDVTVIDLSALWAGPLCGQLLAQAGARVIKVESIDRPDGARLGPSSFFDLLNAEKESVVLDVRTAEGVGHLRRLLAGADVVIESNRPRALEQMGIVAAAFLRASPGPRIWASLTSHGRQRGDRVGFGDVVAAAGGLVTFDEGHPCFVADAVMDPVMGLALAAAILEALAGGGRWLLDAGMAPMAAAVAGDAFDVGHLPARPPWARRSGGPAPELGLDTEAVLAERASPDVLP